MEEITLFVNRMKNIGITIELVSNYPWIYLHKINGCVVKEKYLANHGFTIAFYPIRTNQKIKLTDIGEIFKLIRKYHRPEKIIEAHDKL